MRITAQLRPSSSSRPFATPLFALSVGNGDSDILGGGVGRYAARSSLSLLSCLLAMWLHIGFVKRSEVQRWPCARPARCRTRVEAPRQRGRVTAP